MADNSIREDRWAIADIVTMYNPDGSGDITLPLSQRQWAWNNKRGELKQRKLIDSVMKRFPIPTCILHRTGLRTFQIYDGRHRIETIWRYYNDMFTWDEKKFSELTDEEKRCFTQREIPVTIVSGATPEQLADMFIRLNAGVPLKDYDLLWANRDTPLIRCVDRFVRNNERLSLCFGGLNMKERKDLANWTAIVCGLATNNSGNITTSYIRICSDVGLDISIDEHRIQSGIEAICNLLESANARFPVDDKEKRTLKKVGKVLAFFLDDWMRSEDKSAILEKWVGVIGRLRSSERTNMLATLSTTGAQNLTATKISTVLEKVNRYLTENVVGVSVDDSDDESQ